MSFNSSRVQRPEVNRDAAAVQGGAVGQKHKQNLKPANEKLWHLVIIQAKAKFLRFPSPAASSWAHEKYVKMGGRFIDTAKEKAREKAVEAARHGKQEDRDEKSSNRQKEGKKR